MEDLICREGMIHSIIFQNTENGYTVLRLLNDEGETITVVGCIPCAAPGERLIVSGAWEQHPQHGEQLRATEIIRILPEEESEILRYLSSGICKGVGPVIAQRIVERFGRATFDILEQEPERLQEIRGVTPKKALEIAEDFHQHMGLRRLMAFLVQYELSPVLALRLRRQYGDRALMTLQENPYILSQNDCGVSFSRTDRMALSLGIDAGSSQRLQAAVMFELNHNENNGHVFLPRGKLIAATGQLLNAPEDTIEIALDQLIKDQMIIQEKIANLDACYLRRLWEAEYTVCRCLNALLSYPVFYSRHQEAERIEDLVKEIEQETGISYAEQQREAVMLAGSCQVLLLTGGPGTGKTTTVQGITALFQRMGLKIFLAAPTGRAAKRMSELTGMEAQTIHRLLGQSWNQDRRQVTFQKTEEDPLEADAIIIDEMSMVDLVLFSALLRALHPGTRLVLVGDADQLPSVGAGNVFSDLIRSRQIKTIFLREVFRQASQSAIIRNAHAVNLGQPPQLSNDQGDFFFLCRRAPDRVVSTIVSLCKTRLPENLGILSEQIQVLTPTRKGPVGTVRLNQYLQEALNPRAPDKQEILWGGQMFRDGDRVMQTRNDYDIVWEKSDGTAGSGIFNGDVGKILQIDPGGEWLELDFDGRVAVYSTEQLGELDLAYAQTIHKAQGNEYRCVILAAVPTAPSLMVRGVLYTALTRARELFIAVGDDAVLRLMAEDERQQRRYSGLRWRLTHTNININIKTDAI